MSNAYSDRPRDSLWVNTYYRISDGTRRNRIRAGRLPAPDGHIARGPFWYESTIRQHQPEPAGGDA